MEGKGKMILNDKEKDAIRKMHETAHEFGITKKELKGFIKIISIGMEAEQ